MKKINVLFCHYLLVLILQTPGLMSQGLNQGPMVGLGLLAPVVRSVNHIITAPIRNKHRMARNRSRMRHKHLLRAENPYTDNGDVIEYPARSYEGTPDITRPEKYTSEDSNDVLIPQKLDFVEGTYYFEGTPYLDQERMSKHIKNNKRDEEYYLWSLNNWKPYERNNARSAGIAIDNIYEYNNALQKPEVDVKLLARPSFYRNFEVVPSNEEMRNIIPENSYSDRFTDIPVIEINPEMFEQQEEAKQLEDHPQNNLNNGYYPYEVNDDISIHPEKVPYEVVPENKVEDNRNDPQVFNHSENMDNYQNTDVENDCNSQKLYEEVSVLPEITPEDIPYEEIAHQVMEMIENDPEMFANHYDDQEMQENQYEAPKYNQEHIKNENNYEETQNDDYAVNNDVYSPKKIQENTYAVPSKVPDRDFFENMPKEIQYVDNYEGNQNNNYAVSDSTNIPHEVEEAGYIFPENNPQNAPSTELKEEIKKIYDNEDNNYGTINNDYIPQENQENLFVNDENGPENIPFEEVPSNIMNLIKKGPLMIEVHRKNKVLEENEQNHYNNYESIATDYAPQTFHENPFISYENTPENVQYKDESQKVVEESNYANQNDYNNRVQIAESLQHVYSNSEGGNDVKFNLQPQEIRDYVSNYQDSRMVPQMDQQKLIYAVPNGGNFKDKEENYGSISRAADSSDPRHFHHHHSTHNWFSHDSKPSIFESSNSWKTEQQPQIVINNHNVPVSQSNNNMQIAQTSGQSSTSQSQAVSNFNQENPGFFVPNTHGGKNIAKFNDLNDFWNGGGNTNQNIQMADTSGHSTSSQSQGVSNSHSNNGQNSFGLNQNIQSAESSHDSSSTQSQAVTNEGAGSQAVPSRLFVSNNIQASKTFDGSSSSQAQAIHGSSDQNTQASLTTGQSKSSQSQTVTSQRTPAPYLIDVPPYKQAHRYTRSLPLVRLVTDPNAKLDMPKTLQNFGNVARNSFQDKRQPMHHMKNMVGSARDVFLSALRIPPQGIVIPSQYKIIDTKKEKAVPINDYTYLDNIVDKVKSLPEEAKKAVEPILGSNKPLTVKEKIQERINNLRNGLGSKIKSRSIFSDDTVGSPFQRRSSAPDDAHFTETFSKMGNIFRDSIKSGQQTLTHIGDVAHSARKAFTTTTLGAPRVVRPLMRAPAFEKRQFGFNSDPEKVTFVAPRFLDVTSDGKPKETNDDFIDVGDIMDALGVSNPTENKVGLRRYVVHSKVDNSEESPIIGSRFGEDNEIVKETAPKKKFFIIAEDIDDNEVANDMDIIKELTDILGVNSLRDLMMYMKDTIVENKQQEIEKLTKKLRKLEEDYKVNGSDKVSSNEEMDTFFKGLFTTARPLDDELARPKRQYHHGLHLPANLLRPFMGSPSRIELNHYFRQHGDFEEVQDDSPEDLTSEELLQSKQDEFVEALFDPSEYIAAINPKMYQKMFNEELKFTDKYPKLDIKGAKDLIRNHNIVGASVDDNIGNERIPIIFKDKLLKPYMGKPDKGQYVVHTDYVPSFGYLSQHYAYEGHLNGYQPQYEDNFDDSSNSDEYY